MVPETSTNSPTPTYGVWKWFVLPSGAGSTPPWVVSALSRPGPAWNDELAAYPTDDKIDLAKELEKLTSGIDHRIRVDDSNYADAYGESAVATTTGIRMSGRENGCYVAVSTLADEGEGDDAETQTGFGFSVGRTPDEFDLDRAAREAVDRATRLLGATKPSTTRVTCVARPATSKSLDQVPFSSVSVVALPTL